MENVLQPLAKSVLIPLLRLAAASAADAVIRKKILGSEACTSDLAQRITLIISNAKMEDIMKTFNSLEDSSLFLKDVSKTIQNEPKEQEGRFLDILLRSLGASLLRNMLIGQRINREGHGTIRANYGSSKKKTKIFNVVSFFN